MAGFVSSNVALGVYRETSNNLIRDVKTTTYPRYQQHFTRSKETISQVICDLSPSALILGAGAGHDLPLVEMAHRFAHIVLVDVDVQGFEKIMRSIPKNLQSRFEFRQQDLSGVMGDFSQAVEAILKNEIPYEDFVLQVLNIIPTLKRIESSFRDFSFVSSSLLCSQLVASINDYLKSLTRQFYNKDFVIPESRRQEFDQWLIQVQVDHVKDLARWVHPEGKVYFADHFLIKKMSYWSTEHEKVELCSSQVTWLGSDKVQEMIGELFSKLEVKEWVWAFPPITRNMEIEKEEDGASIFYSAEVKTCVEFNITAMGLKLKAL